MIYVGFKYIFKYDFIIMPIVFKILIVYVFTVNHLCQF